MSHRATAARLLGLSLLLVPSAALSQGVEKTTVTLLLCPFNCGNVAADTILMNQMILNDSPVVMLPQETPGYMYNIREMGDEKHWKRTVFGTEDPIIQLAPKGGSPEIAEFLPEPVPIKFKLLYGEAWWAQGKFFVTFDPAIKTVADLKGKRVSLGLRGQSDWGFFARLFLEHGGHDITPDNTDIRHMTPAALTQQLIDGATDAAISVFGAEPHFANWLIPGPLRQIEATGREFRYIGYPKEAVDAVNAKLGTTFLHVTVPAGTLPGQKEDLPVPVNRGYKAVHPEFPEETAYQIIMQVAALGEKLKSLHPLWSIWSKELMLHGLSAENAHPGAIRAYRELGWWQITESPAYQAAAMKYPG